MTYGADIDRAALEAFNISDEMLAELDELEALSAEASIDPWQNQNIPESK